MNKALTSLAPLQDALQQRPFGLLCDVDGTISPMAPTPAEARVTPRSRALLEALSSRMLVAAVSGRDLPDLLAMVGIPSLVYVGLHGIAWSVDGRNELEPEAQPYAALTKLAAQELVHIWELPGVVIEVKTVGLAFHYRLAPDPIAVRGAILDAIAGSPAAAAFRIQEGVRMVELRPPIAVTKGVALRRLVERFGLRGLLFLGDDLTDVDGFRAARAVRTAGLARAYGIAVAHPEAPAIAAETADFTVAGVSEVEWLLGEIAASTTAR